MYKIGMTLMVSLFALALSACASNGQQAASDNGSKLQSHKLTKEHVKARIDAVADWQISNMDNFEEHIPTFLHRTVEPVGWIQGTLYLGLSRWSEKTNNQRYKDFLVAHGNKHEWRLGDRLYHADDHVVAQYYLNLFKEDNNQKYIQKLTESFDAILSNQPSESLNFEAKGKYKSGGYEHDCQKRWCWSDALFMSPPAWFWLSNLTGDQRYANYADKEYRAVTDYLFDEQSGFYYRDSRFLDRREASGEKIFWSRGNGWVYAGLTSLIDSIPNDDARREWYVDLFKKMSKSLISVQSDSGYWPVSLAAGEHYPVPETSGTAFFLSGLAWGVKNGILPCQTHMPAIENAWSALNAAQKKNGMLGYVQQVGYAPDKVSPDETQLYGTGAYLLAGTELLNLLESDFSSCK